MNRIRVIIKEVTISGGVILVDMEAEDCLMSALLIDSAVNPGWLQKGASIYAIFKETEITLAKNLSGRISTRNRLPCTIRNVVRGQLMSVVSMQFGKYTIESAVTTRAVDLLELKAGQNVTALIKANEITLMQK
jgi:molybdate transport system regulatory protein